MPRYKITVALDHSHVTYLDDEITKHRWASYSHAARFLVEDHRRRLKHKKAESSP